MQGIQEWRAASPDAFYWPDTNKQEGEFREPLNAHRTTVTVVGVDSLPRGVLDNRSVTGEAVKSVHQLSETSHKHRFGSRLTVRHREMNETILDSEKIRRACKVNLLILAKLRPSSRLCEYRVTQSPVNSDAAQPSSPR